MTGTRTTRTIPAGQIGNDAPISIVTEVWTSPELKTVVYSKRTDPRMGEQTFQLTNISAQRAGPVIVHGAGGFHGERRAAADYLSDKPVRQVTGSNRQKRSGGRAGARKRGAGSVHGLDGVHQGKKAFAQRGMNKNGALEQRVGLFGEHQRVEDVDEFAALGGETGGAENRSFEASTMIFIRPAVSSRSMARAT